MNHGVGTAVEYMVIIRTMNKLLLFIPIFLALQAHGQADSGLKKILVPITITKSGDTLTQFSVAETSVGDAVEGSQPEGYVPLDDREWQRLLRNVKKVYPYALECARLMNEADSTMNLMGKNRDRNKYLAQRREELKTIWTPLLEDLTYKQGLLLVKLVNRETGYSAYTLIKEYQNGISAYVWQKTASLYEMNLKDEYVRENEPHIELALQYLGYK